MVRLTIAILCAPGGFVGAARATTARAPPAKTAPPLEELRRSFTVGGLPVPPEVFRDLGDGDLADPGSIRVAIDVQAAIGSNLYADKITSNGMWFKQATLSSKDSDRTEAASYKYIGPTSNKLLVAVSSYSGGGSGTFYRLHILDAAVTRGFDIDGKRYDRITLTEVRSVILGDRWDGEIQITGNAIAITTTGGIPNGNEQKPSTVVVNAERP